MRGLATNGLKMAITSENSNQKENQSNAGQHGLHGATKQKFNFYDYYSKKLAIQDKNVSKKNVRQMAVSQLLSAQGKSNFWFHKIGTNL